MNFTDSIVFYPDWAGYAFEHTLNVLTFLINQPSSISADDFDDHSVPALQTSADRVGTSTAAIVTITSRMITSAPIIVAIPESPAFSGCALVVGLEVAKSMRWKHRRNGKL